MNVLLVLLLNLSETNICTTYKSFPDVLVIDAIVHMLRTLNNLLKNLKSEVHRNFLLTIFYKNQIYKNNV